MGSPSPPPVDLWLREESVGLRRLARGLLGSDADAEDCVQDAWVAAMAAAPPPANPRAWLRGVVRRLASHRWRAGTRRDRRQRAVARAEGVAATVDVAARLEIRRRVLAAVAALDEPYRSTIALRYLEGRSPAQIARLQGVPVKTVKTRLGRALARLRGSLDASHGGDRRTWMPALVAVARPSPGPASATVGSVVGALLAMKKIVAVAVLVVLALGMALWQGAREDARRTNEDGRAVALGAPRLEATAPPSTGAAPTAADALREGDPVPAATFAGRVVDGEGVGVAGARVALVWFGAHPSSGEAVGAAHVVLRRERERHEGPVETSDARGYFRFDRPYASSSFLRVDGDGFATTVSGPHASGTFVVVTTAGDRALRVRVSTADGRPLPAADVRLVADAAAFAGFPVVPRQVLASQVTDAAGEVSVPAPTGEALRLEVVPAEPEWGVVERAVSEGSADVEIRVPSVRVMERRVVDAETGAPVPGAWVDVLRSPGGSRSSAQEVAERRFLARGDGTVRFPRQDAYASAPGYEVGWAIEPVVRLSRSFAVEGVVVDAGGAPVSGAAVLVALPGVASVFQEVHVGASPVAAWSGPDGRFALEAKLPHSVHGLPPPDRGVRSIVALHPAHAPAFADDLAVRPGGRARVTLRFPRPASLAVEVVDDAGRPVAGQLVTVGRVVPRTPSWPSDFVEFGLDGGALTGPVPRETGEDGRLLREGLPPGRHVVRAGNLVEHVELREGERSEVRLVRGRGRFVTGRVVDARGEPVSGATVGLSGGGPLLPPATTNAEGRFRFDDLEPGEYRLFVLGQGGRGSLRDDAPVRAGEDVTVRLPDPARAKVVVAGPPRGTIVEYALTTLTGGRVGAGNRFVSMVAPSDETSPFTPGVGVLVVRAKGYGWTAVRVDAPEGATTDVRVTLAPAATVEGRVRDPSLGERGLVRLRRLDAPSLGDDPRLPGAVSELRAPHEHGNPAVDGAFRLEDVPPGAYELSYGRYEERVWHGVVTERVDLAAGTTGNADLPR